MRLEKISCRQCHGSDFQHDEDGNLVCAFCGTLYASPRAEVACATCGTENPPQARVCMHCGRQLGKQCPACFAINPPGQDHCLECGVALDTLASIFERQKVNDRAAVLRADRLVQTKAEDEAFMQRERARLEQIERERVATIAAQKQQSVAQQRVVLLIGGGIALCMIAVVVVMLLIT